MAEGAPPPGTSPAPGVDAACLPAGHRFHEYVIERPLGGGGFGITYLAKDANLDLPVAIKEYFPSDLVTRAPDLSVSVRAGNEDAQRTYDWGLERFLDEARALATFRHPNIVRVLRYFKLNGTAYIVMEYESGLPLKRWVPQNTPLSQRSMLSIIYPLLDGLEAVHKTGFLHRDIKPDNIYVRADGTPVLLDFGAARRVSANQEMTNIVSPGFAPFEQYHSQGRQGPWTDLYSMGAVMYWMATGKKPVESAARVQKDSMLPASSLAEIAVYGSPLLHAIEWAMHPDEIRRPQAVPAFRAAIQGAERADIDLLLPSPTPAASAPASLADSVSAGGPSVSGTTSAASATSTSALAKRNLLCTIMSLDLLGYSVRSVDDQVAIKKLFHEMIGKSLRGVAPETRISIDTADGAAICFLGDPEEALHSAMLLRDLMGQRYHNHVTVRVGLHMGPVRVVSDLNAHTNVIGDGINVAQRIMDFALGNQVLVSRAYYDVISRITDDTASLFRYLGPYEDKHGRMHEVYAAESPRSGGTTRREGPSTGYTQTLPVRSVKALDDESVHEVEAELARHIGPLAPVLVRKARPLAASVQALRDALAPLVPDAKARELFLNPPPGTVSHSQPPQHRSRPSGAPAGQRPGGASQSQPNTGPAFAPSSHSVPLASRPSGAQSPQHQGNSASVPSATRLNLSDDEVEAVEQALSRFIGPMARMLVRKELGRNGSFKTFVTAVAATVDRPDQREAFLQALKRALPKRQL